MLISYFMGEILRFPSSEERRLREIPLPANDNQEINCMEIQGVLKEDFERILRSLPELPSDMKVIDEGGGYITVKYSLDSIDSLTVVSKYTTWVEREGVVSPIYRGFYSDKTEAPKSKKQRRRN